MKSKNYIYIEPYVYIKKVKNTILFYNTLTGQHSIFQNNPFINELYTKYKNGMLVSEIESHGTLANEREIDMLKSNLIGDIVQTEIPPVIFNTNKYFKSFIKYLDTNSATFIRNSSKGYINEMTFYVNSKTSNPSLYKLAAHKQFLSPYIQLTNSELSVKAIIKIIDELSVGFLCRINITGGNFLLHTEIDDLLKILSYHKAKKRYIINYIDFVDSYKLYKKKQHCFTDSEIEIHIDTPINEAKLRSLLDKPKTQYVYIFYVRKPNDIEIAQNIIDEHNIRKTFFKPLFDGHNWDFLKDYVFLSKSDIFRSTMTFRNIYRREIVNSLRYGHLQILNNGEIYSSLNEGELATIETYTYSDLVEIAMRKPGKGWRLIRKSVQPCNECIYSELCPEISELELMMGKFGQCFKYTQTS